MISLECRARSAGEEEVWRVCQIPTPVPPRLLTTPRISNRLNNSCLQESFHISTKQIHHLHMRLLDVQCRVHKYPPESRAGGTRPHFQPFRNTCLQVSHILTKTRHYVLFSVVACSYSFLGILIVLLPHNRVDCLHCVSEYFPFTSKVFFKGKRIAIVYWLFT